MSMESAVNAWLSQNNQNPCLKFLTFKEVTDEFLQLEIHGKSVQLIIPPEFHCGNIESSDQVFMMVRADDGSDHEFDSALYLLNGRLERVKVGPKCLNTVFDQIARAFQALPCKEKPGKIPNRGLKSAHLGIEGKLVSLEREKSIENGIIYRLAEEARMICKEARMKAQLGSSNSEDKPISPEQVLLWCNVKPVPNSFTVQLEIDLIGILSHFQVAEALGFSLDKPLRINVHLGREFWLQDKISPEFFSEATVTCQDKGMLPEVLPQKGETNEDQDEKIRNGIKMLEHLYGPEVLVPELALLFFKNAGGPMDMTSKQHSADCRNLFVHLLVFIGVRLSTLPDWCLICKKQLPFCASQLCPCNDNFCLYKFEELGLGTAVLPEVQTSPEMVDLKISFALAASIGRPEAFDPFPSFLLEEEEIHDHPGCSKGYAETKEWGPATKLHGGHAFHRGLGCSCTEDGDQKALNGKEKLEFLQSLIKSFPPVSEMQQCANEFELRVKLGKSWFQLLDNNGHNGYEQILEKNFAKHISLPYKVLRFILSSSRLHLHLLQRDVMLDVPNSLHQFAVIQEPEEKNGFSENCHGQASRSFFSFHGSSVENWYSITRYGLRCLVGTLQAPGISLSSQLSGALCYPIGSGIGWPNGTLAEACCLVAICEVVSTQGNFVAKKHMVISPRDEDDIALRYLIVLKESNVGSHIHLIDGYSLSGKIDLHRHYDHVRREYMRKDINRCLIYKQQRQAAFAKNVGKASSGNWEDTSKVTSLTSTKLLSWESQRAENFQTRSSIRSVMREYHSLVKVLENEQSSSSLVGVTLNLPDENDICRWHVCLSQILFKGHPLYKDLVEYAREKMVDHVGILLELMFPADYPFAPPFVRIVRPRFNRYTGHITVGGAICMELLTESGWSPACSIESLLVQVQNAIIEGGGRLDRKALLTDTEYNEKEAREAFLRTALDHGWIKL